VGIYFHELLKNSFFSRVFQFREISRISGKNIGRGGVIEHIFKQITHMGISITLKSQGQAIDQNALHLP